jgi:magnesium transporter
MTFKAYYLSPEDTLRRNLSEKEIRSAFESNQGLLWVDITGASEEDAKFLVQNFRFHHLAIEDCVGPTIHSPKIDDLGSYLFIIVHGISPIVEVDVVETAELAIFLGSHFVVSIHRSPLRCTEAVMRLVEDDGRNMRHGADFLAHALIDALIDNVLLAIDSMSDMSEEIEEETIRNPQQAVLESILKLKRSTLRIYRVMASQREILSRLSRGEFPIIKEEARIFYRDVYDHLMQIIDLTQNIKDAADNALDTYMSSVANRQNETMRVLSMVATIFMPLTLIAGIYGMNFENLPELKWYWGYFAVLGLMAAVVIIVVVWFWARKWIKFGRRATRDERPATKKI